MKLSRQLKLIKSAGYQPCELVKNDRSFGNISVPIIRRLHQSFRRGFLLLLFCPANGSTTCYGNVTHPFSGWNSKAPAYMTSL
jgi:hypothetical protein